MVRATAAGGLSGGEEIGGAVQLVGSRVGACRSCTSHPWRTAPWTSTPRRQGTPDKPGPNPVG